MKLFREWEDARQKVNQWKSEGQMVVFTNGCFDLLHPGHLQYLSEAKDSGDRLIIGLNADDSVKRLKGEGRPVRKVEERALMLAGLEMVDAVVAFSEDTPLQLIEYLRPDILVKGGDYEIKDIVGAKEVRSYGGQVKKLSFQQGFSTTALIEKIKRL
jgi:rfaE bifunctional protein nucleotidyltransferase chain/domain